MNWFKKSQSQEARLVLFNMLMQAKNTPVTVYDIAHKFQGVMPNVIQDAISYAYPMALQQSGGMLNGSQMEIMNAVREMIVNVQEQQKDNQTLDSLDEISQVGFEEAANTPA